MNASEPVTSAPAANAMSDLVCMCVSPVWKSVCVFQRGVLLGIWGVSQKTGAMSREFSELRKNTEQTAVFVRYFDGGD